MSILDQIVAKARNLPEPAKPRPRFTLPPPTERCDCGGAGFVREPDQRGWSCLACELRRGRVFPLLADQDGWQGHIVGYDDE